MGENVWLNAHCWCTRKKMVWQESETCWRYPSAPENWGSFKNIYKSVVSWHRLFILRSHGDFRSRCQLYSLKLETIRLWFRSSFWNPNMGRRPKNRWLIVGVVLFLSVFFSFHLQVWEFSEISSEDRHAGSSSKKKNWNPSPTKSHTTSQISSPWWTTTTAQLACCMAFTQKSTALETFWPTPEQWSQNPEPWHEPLNPGWLIADPYKFLMK